MYQLLSQGILGGGINPPPNIPDRPDDVINMIKTLISTAYAVAGVAAVVMIIYGGYTILVSSGEPDKMRKGQNTLFYAIIGLVIIVSSSLIFNFVGRLLGVQNLISVLNLPFL